ncbi:MAG: DUF2254 domain-containing protein, partial [Bradymonadaceae bacterium]
MMKANLLKFWERLRTSYWFLPTLMTMAVVILSIGTLLLDHRIGQDWMEQVVWLDTSKPEGARALLSAVATSMITVAGVTFSITIASVSLASSQFGPRILTNFMRDRGNQFVLGTFIATFVYSLLILRTIRGGDDDTVFVPENSILVALGLTLASVGVLIFFIHHISDSLRVSTVIANIGQDLDHGVQDLFPTRLGMGQKDSRGARGERDLPENFDDEAVAVLSVQDGYIQGVDGEGLLRATHRQ